MLPKFVDNMELRLRNFEHCPILRKTLESYYINCQRIISEYNYSKMSILIYIIGDYGTIPQILCHPPLYHPIQRYFFIKKEFST